MTMKIALGRAATSCLAVSAASMLLLVAAAQPSTAQTTFLPCTFTDADVSGLRTRIASALGINSNFVATPIVIVPTFNPDLGQQTSPGSGPNVTYSKMVICTNSGNVGSVVTGTNESDPFPSGSAPVDILEIHQTSYVLIDANGTRKIRICHTDQESDCLEGTRQ